MALPWRLKVRVVMTAVRRANQVDHWQHQRRNSSTSSCERLRPRLVEHIVECSMRQMVVRLCAIHKNMPQRRQCACLHQMCTTLLLHLSRLQSETLPDHNNFRLSPNGRERRWLAETVAQRIHRHPLTAGCQLRSRKARLSLIDFSSIVHSHCVLSSQL